MTICKIVSVLFHRRELSLRSGVFLVSTLPVFLFAQGPTERIAERVKQDDTNQDGKVTENEFTGSLQLFRRLDADGDGAVFLEEIEIFRQGLKRNRIGQQTRTQIKPDQANVKYGKNGRNVFDVYLPTKKINHPAPLMIWIHGGGFRSGDKTQGAVFARHFTEQGFCYISLNYRLSHQAIAPACFYDCARALQFIRCYAATWNIDKNRVAVGGGSAGAGLALWMAFQPDLADPEAEDPVLRESSRVQALILANAQTSYDPRWIKQHIPGEAWRGDGIQELFGIEIDNLDHLPAEKYTLMEACSPINFFTADAPPMVFFYRRSKNPEVAIANPMDGIHHPLFGLKLKEQANCLGVDCEVFTIENEADQVFYNRRWKYALSFLKRVFNMQPPKQNLL